MQREKNTYSGPLLEADFYPIFEDGRRIPTRAPKTKPSTEAQKKYNHTQKIKKFVRKVNANFDTTDYWLHPTYRPKDAPQSEEELRRNIRNYFRRVKTMRASEAKRLRADLIAAESAAEKLPDNKFLVSSIDDLKARIKKLEAPFKTAYTIEEVKYQRGIYAGRSNWHCHIFLTGGIDNKTLERMWSDGARVNCNNYQPDKFGPEAAATYMCKDPRGKKSFSCSKNLTKPEEECKDGVLSRGDVALMATQRVDDRAYWENQYKGYRFLRCYSRFNEYNGHWYVSVIMYKADIDAPQWQADEWITTDYIPHRRRSKRKNE